MRVVIVGSGKLGCGYLVPLFREAGHEVLLGCRTRDTAGRIRAAGGWRVRATGEPSRQVRGVTAAAVGTAEMDRAVAAADLIVLSVGEGKVAEVARHLVPGLAARRGRPLDVWVVGNADCARRVREALAEAEGAPLPPLGIAGAIARVAVSRGSWHEPGVPEFVGDAARRLDVDALPLHSVPPALPGVRATCQFGARLREKLFVFNAGHALTAYLGWLRGHRTIDTAIRDPFVRPVVAGALLAARRAVLAAHPCLCPGHAPDLAADVRAPVAGMLARFGNAELADPVVRVARDPIRKLAPGERLLGPVALLGRTAPRGLAPFVLGVTAVLLYGHGDGAVLAADASARRLRRLLDERGVTAVMTGVCGLAADDAFATAVADRYHDFLCPGGSPWFPPPAPSPAGVPGRSGPYPEAVPW